MTTSQTAPGTSRRFFLKAAGTTLLAIAVMPNGLVSGDAWAQMPKGTKPETFASLVQMSRDCYPHDRIEDKYYANAVGVLDQAARTSQDDLALLEEGMAGLNKAAVAKYGKEYAKVEKEADRVALLQAMEGDPFFQKVRSNLVVGLYNQKELWPVFGYEGSSYDKGGYIERGFNDIDWLS